MQGFCEIDSVQEEKEEVLCPKFGGEQTTDLEATQLGGNWENQFYAFFFLKGKRRNEMNTQPL